MLKSRFCLLICLLLLGACATSGAENARTARIHGTRQSEHAKAKIKAREKEKATLSKMENAIADKIISQAIADYAGLSPETASRLGLPGHHAEWDPPGNTNLASKAQVLRHYAQMLRRSVNIDKLTQANKANVRMLEYLAQRAQLRIQFNDYLPLINLEDGPQARLPLFLVDEQPATSEADLLNYISKTRAFAPYVHKALDVEKQRSQAPVAGLNAVDAECAALTNGRPFTKRGDDSPLLDDFKTKLRGANLAHDRQTDLLSEFNRSLSSISKGCAALAKYTKSREASVSLAIPTKAYAASLAWFTSTDMPPSRLITAATKATQEIEAQIMKETNSLSMTGELRERLDNLRQDTHHRIPPDESNTQSWLNELSGYVFNLDASLQKMLAPEPNTDLEIRSMPAFIKASGTAAFYRPAARPNGTAIAYFNLPDLPDYEIEATTYRYTIPGQHAIPLGALGRFMDIPAFSQGWALYSLRLPGSYGYYKGSYANLGRLLVTAEAIAEARVDLGINVDAWRRDKAVNWLLAHTVVTPAVAGHITDRIITHPGAATAALAGMSTFEKLHRQCQSTLGDKCTDLAFNRVLLQYGPLTLPLVEEGVQQWLASQTDGKMAPVTPNPLTQEKVNP